jgi:hypothetical protein
MSNPRIFVSFAIEDERLRDLFIGQARHEKVPYELIDMSVKQPWDTSWKINCRSRIKGCDGVVVLITKNLKQASGAIWEINCAKEEKIPMLGVYIGGASISDRPTELYEINSIEWTWSGVATFVNGLR